jgi:hypothetical protein
MQKKKKGEAGMRHCKDSFSFLFLLLFLPFSAPFSSVNNGAPSSFVMAAKKSPKQVLSATKPHIAVNKKFPGLKQISKDPAIFTIDKFLDKATCERYMWLGPEGESSGAALKVDSATFGGSMTAQNRKSTTWFLKYSSAPELVKGVLDR